MVNWSDSGVKLSDLGALPTVAASETPTPWRARVRNWLPHDRALALAEALREPELPWEWVFMDGQATSSIPSARVASMARSQVSAIWRSIHS